VGVLDAIGNTPLIELVRIAAPAPIRVWAKLEAANPGGSIKDRPAARIIADALADGSITPWTTVIESTSGNMGVGLAQSCGYHGIPLICVVDSRATVRNVRMLKALGAEVRMVETPDPKTGDLLVARRTLVAELLESMPHSFNPNQYANQSNPAAHADGTMREIDEALDGELDYVFVATSTTGTLVGCADYLRAEGRDTKVVAVDSTGSALFGGVAGSRRIPGFGAGIQTELSQWVEFDRLVRVTDLACVIGCRRIAQREALLVGGSSGGVAFALAAVAPSLPTGSRCALIFPDAGAGYLDTVFDDDWVAHELGCPPDRLAELV
jgi:2,3-diaminopropionate biosynthesis protein SbnA